MNNFSSSVLKDISQNSIVKTQIMSNVLFEKWRQYIYNNCGIYYQDNKKYLLESRLLKRIHYLGLSSFDNYLEYVLDNVNGLSEK